MEQQYKEPALSRIQTNSKKRPSPQGTRSKPIFAMICERVYWNANGWAERTGRVIVQCQNGKLFEMFIRYSHRDPQAQLRECVRNICGKGNTQKYYDTFECTRVCDSVEVQRRKDLHSVVRDINCTEWTLYN